MGGPTLDRRDQKKPPRWEDDATLPKGFHQRQVGRNGGTVFSHGTRVPIPRRRKPGVQPSSQAPRAASVWPLLDRSMKRSYPGSARSPSAPVRPLLGSNPGKPARTGSTGLDSVDGNPPVRQLPTGLSGQTETSLQPWKGEPLSPYYDWNWPWI